MINSLVKEPSHMFVQHLDPILVGTLWLNHCVPNNKELVNCVAIGELLAWKVLEELAICSWGLGVQIQGAGNTGSSHIFSWPFY